MKGSIALKKTIALTAMTVGLAFSLTANGRQDISPRGVEAAVNKEFSSISEISLDGVSSFQILEGENCSLELKGDEAYVDAVSLKNENGYLEIISDSGRPVSVVITTPSLVSLSLSDGSSGSLSMGMRENPLTLSLTRGSSLAIKGELNTSELILHVSGSHIDGVVHTNLMDIRGLSGADLNLRGYSHDLELELLTDSVALLDGLNVDRADIRTSQSAALVADFPGISTVEIASHGSSSVDLTMNGILRADVLNDSSLVYSGNVTWAGKTVGHGEEDDAVITRR